MACLLESANTSRWGVWMHPNHIFHQTRILWRAPSDAVAYLPMPFPTCCSLADTIGKTLLHPDKVATWTDLNICHLVLG
jgi:hypothetical protein